MRRIAEAASPDAALASLDAFLARLPSGVQLFALMQANPPLLDLLVDICGTAPELARYLGGNAGVLDAVISKDFYRPLRGASRARRRARRASRRVGDYETALNAARVWMKERHFRIGVHLLRGLAEPEEAAVAYSAVADAVIAALWPIVVAEFAAAARAAARQGRGGRRLRQARQPRDDRDLGPRPDRDLRRRGRRGLDRQAAAGGHRLLRAADPGADRGAVGADGRGRALQGRHAAAALGPAGAARHLARRLPPLPGRGRLDLGAYGADPRPGRRRAAGARGRGGGGDRRGADPAARRRPRCAPTPPTCAAGSPRRTRAPPATPGR